MFIIYMGKSEVSAMNYIWARKPTMNEAEKEAEKQRAKGYVMVIISPEGKRSVMLPGCPCPPFCCDCE